MRDFCTDSCRERQLSDVRLSESSALLGAGPFQSLIFADSICSLATAAPLVYITKPWHYASWKLVVALLLFQVPPLLCTFSLLLAGRAPSAQFVTTPCSCISPSNALQRQKS